MYTYKKIDHKYIVSIDNNTEIVKALHDFCEKLHVKSGTINGIGAIGQLCLRFYNPKTKKYEDREFREQMEIANLIGNVSQMDGAVYLHLHVTVGRSDYTSLAGHLQSATTSGVGEFVVEDFGESVTRVYSPELGLNVYHLDDRES